MSPARGQGARNQCCSPALSSWSARGFQSLPAAQARSPLAVSAVGDRAAPSPKMMENAVFMSFTFYSTILILKMYVVAIITGQVRLRKKAFANPEDALRNGGLQYYREDPDVERCRRRVRGGAGIPPALQGDPWQLLAKRQWEVKGLIN
ncbi:uncharacterized protein LOC142418213 isoform X3 [Mycteria americana]|uniref:uncharacterized protein LOC142418213 isoform X3 n=1 Tax=Mycteria americana TaxID=33587 RepID=UPI003F58EB64